MNASSVKQNRRSNRSNLWMAASLERGGRAMSVILRDLSPQGAQVAGDHELAVGDEVIFHKNELSVAGQVVWVEGRKAGILFTGELDPATVLRHISAPTPRPLISYRRPGLRSPASY